MLRIDVHTTIEATNFTLQGKLKGPWVMELERCWKALAIGGSRQRVVVDLTGVTFIDAQGKQLLERMHEDGATLVTIGLLPCSIMEEIEQEEQQNLVPPP